MNSEFADEAGKQIPVEFGDKGGKTPLVTLKNIYRRLKA